MGAVCCLWQRIGTEVSVSAAHLLHGASTLLNCSVLVGARLLEHLCAAAHIGERRDARESSTRDDRAGTQIEIQRRASRCRWSSDAIHDDASSLRCEFAALRCLSSIISRARRRVSCIARPRRESAHGGRRGGKPCIGHGVRAPGGGDTAVTHRDALGRLLLLNDEPVDTVLSANAATRHGRSALQSRRARHIRKGRVVRRAWSNCRSCSALTRAFLARRAASPCAFDAGVGAIHLSSSHCALLDVAPGAQHTAGPTNSGGSPATTLRPALIRGGAVHVAATLQPAAGRGAALAARSSKPQLPIPTRSPTRRRSSREWRPHQRNGTRSAVGHQPCPTTRARADPAPRPQEPQHATAAHARPCISGYTAA